MVDRDIIESYQSSWASPVVLLSKKHGLTRFCVDYHKVNEVKCKDHYSVKQIDNTLDAFRGFQYFSAVDLYWQVKDGFKGHQQDTR